MRGVDLRLCAQFFILLKRALGLGRALYVLSELLEAVGLAGLIESLGLLELLGLLGFKGYCGQ